MLKLNIGTRERIPGWKTFDIQPGADFQGNCTWLIFGPNSVDTIYASHILEHLSYADIVQSLKEFYRVLKPGGEVMISVPNFSTLARMFFHTYLDSADRATLLHMIFGGQVDEYDFHKVGLNYEFLGGYLQIAGFVDIREVESFGLFEDSSVLKFYDVPISLNLQARKP